MGITFDPNLNKNPEVPNMGTIAEPEDDHRFVVTIGNQPFHIEAWMYNQLEGFKPFALPFFFVDGLVIEETLDDWNAKGWIIISTDYEILERGSPSAKKQVKIDAPFLLRTDGRNKISIRIYPIATSTIVLPKPEWEMYYDFVIYDIEDIKTDSATKKSRKFYFWDERYQTLLERNIEWSTSSSSVVRDEQRTMLVSDAMRSIIETASSNTSQSSSPKLMIGSSKGPKGIDDPNQPFANFDLYNWDKGTSSGSPDYEGSIFYTSPSNTCALDDLNYVYSLFKSEDGSPAFLMLDRYNRQGGKRFSLVSLGKLIQNAENSQIERIVVADNVDPTELSPYFNRAPYDPNENSMVKNFQSGIASIITDYRFSPMVPIDDMYLINQPTHSYKFSTGQFDVNFKNNTATDLLNNMTNIAKKGLYSFAKDDGNSAQILLNLNKTKTSGLMTSNSFTPRTFFPKDFSYVSMARDLLLLNQALYFSSPGLTIRTPGKFIFVDRESSTDEKNPFDDRFLGQWMVSKVTHHFTKDGYTTNVISTKVDIFNKWWDDSKDKY